MPGNSPGMLIHADTLGADAVILDLEDAVPPAEKDAARCLVRHALDTPVFAGRNPIVRVNAISSPYFADDVAAIVPHSPAFLLLPKVDSAADVTVADETASSPGVHQVVMKAGQQMSSTHRAANAGFMKFCPVPPNSPAFRRSPFGASSAPNAAAGSPRSIAGETFVPTCTKPEIPGSYRPSALRTW